MYRLDQGLNPDRLLSSNHYNRMLSVLTSVIDFVVHAASDFKRQI